MRDHLLAWLFLLPGLLLWPSGSLLDSTPAVFLVHGAILWRCQQGGFRACWPMLLAAAAWAAFIWPWQQAIPWLAGLLLLPLFVRKVLPDRRHRLYAHMGIERLMWRIGLLSLPLASLAALTQPTQFWSLILLLAPACWMVLLLFAVQPYSPEPGRLIRRRGWQMLAALTVLAPQLWWLWPAAGVLPEVMLLLPVLLFAAPRLGVAVLSVTLLGVISLLSLSAHAGYGAWQVLQQHVAVWLLALAVGLLCGAAVLGDLHRRRERLLGDVRAQFESLLNQSSSLMTLKDMDGRYLLVNLNFARLFGRPASFFKGKTSHEVFASDEARRIREHDLQVMQSLESREFEEEFCLGDRHYRMLSSVFPLFDSDGLPSGVGSISVDISLRAEEERSRIEAIEKYQAVVEQSLVGIYIMQDELMAYVNPKLAELVGYPESELIGKPFDFALAPGESDKIQAQIRRRMRENVQVMHYSTRLLHQLGEVVDVEIHSRLMDYRGRRAIIGVVMDITDRVAANSELRLAATVFENATEGILVTDHDGHIVMVNSAFTRITGFAPDEAIGRVSRMLKSGNRQRNKALIDSLQAVGHWKGEMNDRRKTGEPYTAELSISAVRDAHGRLSHYVGVFSDITGRKQAEDRLQFLASHDPLTRLPNRSALIEEIDTAILTADEAVPKLALMFIDLDRFKLINDSFGHQAGDEVLHEIAARLLQSADRYGLVARLGGDEFTLIVHDFDGHEDLGRMAEEVLAALARPMRVADHEVFVSGSIGISVYPNDGVDAATLLKNADAAMYRAKEAGKNTYQFFDAEMNSQTFERLLMESGLRQALERGEFELHYQPQVCSRSHAVTGVEALLRWRHPHLGLVSPARFIPLAEETGLIKPIGQWVLRTACEQMVQWDQRGIHLPQMAVNLSARQFEQQSLLSDVSGVLDSTGLAAERLELEITESMLMQNPQEAIELLRELKAMGLKLSIDDFGTGYSSLSNLKRFPLDKLKIDRSFVEGLPADQDSAAITEAIIAMAHKLHYIVVAEGVETAAQGEFLSQSGCEALQGYYFSKPLPAANLESWLAARQQGGDGVKPLQYAFTEAC